MTSVKSVSNNHVPTVVPLLALGGILLASALGAAGWIYVEGSRALETAARALDTPARGGAVASWFAQVDAWGQRLTLASAVSGTGLMLAMTVGVGWWRRRLVQRFTQMGATWLQDSRQLQEVQFQVEKLSQDKRKIEAEMRGLQSEFEKRVEERTVNLAKAHAHLEEELNERRQAEKMLALQTKELERSKDVLELHVQVRTQELQKLQRRYESILNSAGEGIYGLDLHGKTVFVNPAAAKLTGWKVEDLVGKFEKDMFRPTASAASGAPSAADPATDKVFFRKDGTPFPVEYLRTPIKEKEKLVGEVVMFKDITERKRADEALARKAAELSRSNAELEQFAFVASHDLQEPLRKIQAFGDRLKTKCDAVQLSDGRDYLERMQSAAARMQTLINDLLTFSRVISASQPFVPVDLGAVVKGVLGDLEVRIEQTKARVDVGELPTLDADPMQMRQLFQNLIGNALKFQPPNQSPSVRINAQILQSNHGAGSDTGQVTEVCELTVSDNGIGFDEKYIDKIFAVFQRLHGRNEFEGTGVGLAVCRRITDRHEGTITARSKPGEGATFVIHLPVRHVNKTAEQPSESQKLEPIAA